MGRTRFEGALVIARRFDAPRELVWKAFTEPERLAHWWAAEDGQLEVLEFDLRPGGSFRYRIRTADGGESNGNWIYQQVVAPERLVFVARFTDPSGEVREMVSTLMFSERQGKTLVTNQSIPASFHVAEQAA